MVRYAIGLLLLGVLFASGVGLLHTGVYGWTIFVAYPWLLGGLTCWVARPKSGRAAGWYGSIAALVASSLLLLIRIEGVICLFLSLPLTLPLGCFGGWFAYRVMSSKRASRGAMAMLLTIPPATYAYDTHAQPPIYSVTTAIEIAAPPERVWRRIVNLSQLPNPHEWYFRAGLAYPTSARIEGTGAGATRYCDFSTGPVVESIEVWDAPRVLRFRVTQNPAPMREWSPYGEIAPKHLHGYLISREGEFRLTPLSGNRTLLEGTSWYQHGLWPAPYWRLWSDAIVHRIHLRVFNQIKALAEH
jgi:uncharacterized protein YndB with AHSA1/START domain